MQPMTMFFRVGNVDDEAVEAYVREHPEEHNCLFRAIVLAHQDTFPVPREHIGIYRTPQRGVWRVNCSRLSGLDGTNARDLTQGEVEGRKQVWALMEFFHRYLPGFANATLLDAGAQVGVRETRHIVGDYTLTADDLATGRRFADVIALGSFPVDIHPVTGKGGGIATALEMGLRTAQVYEIPYRALVPKGIEQLLVAGRTLSATHEAAGAVRVMPSCMAMGQAAGVAGAIAAAEEILVREMPVARLRQILREQKAILSVE